MPSRPSYNGSKHEQWAQKANAPPPSVTLHWRARPPPNPQDRKLFLKCPASAVSGKMAVSAQRSRGRMKGGLCMTLHSGSLQPQTPQLTEPPLSVTARRTAPPGHRGNGPRDVRPF
ncbi:hypothetical protein ColLi_08747 [Colletotrichum liriopes]|uniref:Uncharacterized protein n=1 Tax=Colletotrichum liriopes TaxID=708192 RepID=A0AA37GSA7_9PEZI|nr:hypothetical protein ColLi_08747 [Colletotrichum liriopes]